MARGKAFSKGEFKLPKTIFMYKVNDHMGGEILYGPYMKSQKGNLIKQDPNLIEYIYVLDTNGDYTKI